VPEGLRLVLDPSVRRTDGGSVLIGGAPATLLRLSPAGRKVVDRLVGGAQVPPGGSENSLARRLLDLGMAHPRPPAAGRPSVTVVIPVRDDPAGLAATLARIGLPADVVVVDDGSVDAQAVRRAAAAAPVPARVLRIERAEGPAAARNLGWQATPAEIVVFVDANCEPRDGWLEGLVAHLADPTVAAAAPRVVALAAPGSPRWLHAYEERRSPLDLGAAEATVRPRGRVAYVPAAALAVRRTTLEAIGGFDPTLRWGEDVDLVWRLTAAGWTVRYVPRVIVGHPVRPTLRAVLRQRFDYGASAAPLAARHGSAAAPVAASGWSLVAWWFAATRRPLPALGLVGGSGAALAASLTGLRHPGLEAGRLAVLGHLHAGRLVAAACRRTWWPLTLLAALAVPRIRPAAVALAVVPPLLERRPQGLALPAWLALRLADDVAYGTGVWAGAVRARSLAALRPHLTR
jgi:mycofactocin system glycosyltransferase